MRKVITIYRPKVWLAAQEGKAAERHSDVVAWSPD